LLRGQCRVRTYISEIQKELRLEERRLQHPSKLKKSKQAPPVSVDQSKDEMKSVMDRLESRQLADILSKGWDSSENQDLVGRLLANRVEYADAHEMPPVRVEELDEDEDSEEEEGEGSGDAPAREEDSPFEALYEHLVDDLAEMYSEEVRRAAERGAGAGAGTLTGGEAGAGAGAGSEAEDDSFSGRIMAMMDEKYQLRAVERELRDANRYGERC
jgi:hypothetical protein